MHSRNLSSVGSPDVYVQVNELCWPHLDTYILPTVQTTNNKLLFQSLSEILSTESDDSKHHKERGS